MNKARVMSPEAMSEEQVREDISMTHEQRLNLAFQLSDLAREFHPQPEDLEDESSSIPWIVLKKIAPGL